LEIVEITFRDVHPPTEVAPSFEDVVSAQEDYETFIEEARGYRKDLLPRARGSSHRDLKQAQSHTNLMVSHSYGKTESFRLVQEEFNNAKEITRFRLVLESLESSLPGTRKYILMPNKENISREMWFYVESGNNGEQSSIPGETKSSVPLMDSSDTQNRIQSEEDAMDIINEIQRMREER